MTTLADEVKGEIKRRMAEQEVSRSELSRRLGVVPTRVTRILDYTTPGMRLDLIERVADALGLEVRVTFVKRKRGA